MIRLIHSVAALLALSIGATASSDFQLADGFDISLFASETNGVVKPIQMRFDCRGRLWVIGSTVYPQIEPGQIPDDKVLILEDTDQDGRCDKTTVFASGLMIPTGLEVVKDGAYVGHGPELLFLKDTDGDGKADERKVLLRGFGTGDNHQNINSFLWGPGGELWMSQGLHIHSNVETPWGLIRMEQAGLWRFWPKRLKLEPFYGTEYEPQNPWGFVFTDWGEPIVMAGNNSSAIYPVPGQVSRRKPEPPSLIWRNGNGRKTSGADIVGTTHFPEEWQGKLIAGGYINNAIWGLSILDDGAGFALEDFKPLITTTNRSFRPVDVKFGPDGALYICDWYNPIIGHYQASFRHPDRDKTHGRIWRVTAKGRALTKPPDLAGTDLVKYLDSPDRWTRQFAKRALAEIPVSAERLDSELAQKEMLGVQQAREVVAPDLVEKLVHAKNPGARAYAASVIGSWADRLTNALSLLRPLASDPHPRVRLQAVIASTYVASPNAIEIARIASEQPTDKFLEYALNQAVFALKPYWLPTLKAGPNLRMLVQRDRTPDTLAALRAMPRDTGIVELLAEIGDANDFTELLQLGTPEALRALAQTARSRTTRPSCDLAEALRPRLNDTNAVALAGIWKVTALRDDLRKANAIEALADLGDREAVLSYATNLNPTAIAMLTRFDLPKAASLAPPVLNEEIVSAFLQRKGGGTVLAEALASHPPNKETAEMILRVMNSSGRRDEKLATLVLRSRLREEANSTSNLAALVRAQGNGKRGAEIFHRPELGCIACHSVNGQGGTIGPDLSALGTAQPLDFIIGAILDPQKEIKEGFMSISITTHDGEELQGYLRRESPDDLTIRDVLQNRDIRLPRSRIKEKRQNGSVMPTGLVDSLSRAELADLIRYLSELGTNQDRHDNTRSPQRTQSAR
ncbi:MAG TPA: PVC-type heme-binding CxxCH protein [Verrucomicrobiae bacterium]|nr:PVC-type heme-binding CxxCH protein [Verrucomicrobiae bacterium]